MKIAVAFLGKKRKSSPVAHTVLNKINVKSIHFSFVIYLGLGVVALCFFAKYLAISPDLLCLATNFRQADDKKFEISKALNMYGLYNKDNYVVQQTTTEDTVEKAENKVPEHADEKEILDGEAKDKTEQAVFGNSKPQVTITENSPNIQRITIDKMKILNYSSKREIPFDALLDANIVLTKSSDKILLYNTHTSESYANSEHYQFEYTGTRRTTDANYNMLAIAKELDNNLKSKGFQTSQNTTPHDYGTYTSAYSKSRITVKDALVAMGGAGLSIDVHRDAVENLDFRPVVNIKGVQVAQCMLVMVVGSDTTKNEYYEDNLKLAFKIQRLADEIYPGLFRPMIIRNSVYNQDLNRYSCLIEVGASGNSIEEAKLATRCIANLLNIIYKD